MPSPAVWLRRRPAIDRTDELVPLVLPGSQAAGGLLAQLCVDSHRAAANVVAAQSSACRRDARRCPERRSAGERVTLPTVPCPTASRRMRSSARRAKRLRPAACPFDRVLPVNVWPRSSRACRVLLDQRAVARHDAVECAVDPLDRRSRSPELSMSPPMLLLSPIRCLPPRSSRCSRAGQTPGARALLAELSKFWNTVPIRLASNVPSPAPASTKRSALAAAASKSAERHRRAGVDRQHIVAVEQIEVPVPASVPDSVNVSAPAVPL